MTPDIQDLQDKIAVFNAQNDLNEARYVQVKNALAKQISALTTQISDMQTKQPA